MSWVRLDDKFYQHPKVLGLSDKAFRLYVNSLCFTALNDLDGEIPPHALVSLRGNSKTADELVKAVLWDTTSRGSWVIHDYLEYNRSKAELTRERERKALAGQRGGFEKAARSQNRDRSARLAAARDYGTHTVEEWQEMVDAYGGQCLLCGGTPVVRDHIIPLYQGGGDTIQNIQPLCRQCNSGKGADTADHRVGRPATLAKWLAPATPSATGSSMPPSPSQSHPVPETSSPSETSSLSASERDFLETALSALPQKYRYDEMTRQEMELFAGDYAGKHVELANAISECRRNRELCFPGNLRKYMPGGQRNGNRNTGSVAQSRVNPSARDRLVQAGRLPADPTP